MLNDLTGEDYALNYDFALCLAEAAQSIQIVTARIMTV